MQEALQQELDIKALVDDWARLDKLTKEAKVEIEQIKGKLQAEGLKKLQDTKLKQYEFWGSGPNKATVNTSETVKILSATLLKQKLNVLFSDYVKEKPSYEPTDPFKRILAAISLGAYTETTLDEVIRQMGVEEKIAKTLKRKLRGTWEKDVALLEQVAGMPRDKAEHFAYFVKDAIDFERIVKILEGAGHKYDTPEFDEALSVIKHAVVVEEGVKVGINYEDEKAT